MCSQNEIWCAQQSIPITPAFAGKSERVGTSGGSSEQTEDISEGTSEQAEGTSEGT